MAADPQSVSAPAADSALASVRAVVTGTARVHTHAVPDDLVRAYGQFIPELEQELWARGCDATLLERYQAAHRQMERLIAERGEDRRHKFIVVVSVADRPQLLKHCLDSLARLCELYHYGGLHNGRYPKVAALIVDDSSEPANREEHRVLADECAVRGIDTLYCDPDEQLAWLDALPAAQRLRLGRILGEQCRNAFHHKGSSVMRNISYLKLRDLWREANEPLLFHFIDCDQEFQVKTAAPDGDRDVYALPYFHLLDQIFSTTDAVVATGKVVGDPPVSPAVMTSTFLDDVIGFMQRLAETEPHGPCRFHQAPGAYEERGAIYHDMPERFGFTPAQAPYDYACTLTGDHGNGDCLDNFARRLDRFFFGEHPTRKTRYVYQGRGAGVTPARTVYAGNYVLRPEGLCHFIPFAGLRLRMPGPTLGRILKAELGNRFIAANLPMLHQRTLGSASGNEFRPGVDSGEDSIDISGEFVRQFYGDVMLFTMERLTATGPLAQPEQAVILAELEVTRAELLGSYNERQRVIGEKLARLEACLDEPGAWWNQAPSSEDGLHRLRAFVADVARNFVPRATGYRTINDATDWSQRRAAIAEAITSYAGDRAVWETVVFGS